MTAGVNVRGIENPVYRAAQNLKPSGRLALNACVSLALFLVLRMISLVSARL